MSTRYQVVSQALSTQDLAREHLEEQPDTFQDTVWVRAEKQMAGRGRQGRRWIAHEGDLLLSAATRCPPRSDIKKSFATLVAGRALWEALEEFSPLQKGLFLKWPNDLFWRDSTGHFHKIAGILGESPKANILILGWGVNISTETRTLEDKPEHFATHLLETGIQTTAAQLAEKLMTQWNALRIQWWNSSESFVQETLKVLTQEAMKPMWGLAGILSHSGESVRARGLDTEGSLVVETSSGQRRSVSSGEFTLSI